MEVFSGEIVHVDADVVPDSATDIFERERHVKCGYLYMFDGC